MSRQIKIVDIVDEAVLEPQNQHFPSITKDFLLAGHAYFVVINPKATRFAYVIRGRAGKRGSQWQDTTSFYLRVFFKGSYRYVGVVNIDTGEIVPTGRSEFLKGCLEFDVAQWALTTVFNATPIKPGYTITHNEKCARCGRMLVERGDRETGFHLDCTS